MSSARNILKYCTKRFVGIVGKISLLKCHQRINSRKILKVSPWSCSSTRKVLISFIEFDIVLACCWTVPAAAFRRIAPRRNISAAFDYWDFEVIWLKFYHKNYIKQNVYHYITYFMSMHDFILGRSILIWEVQSYKPTSLGFWISLRHRSNRVKKHYEVFLRKVSIIIFAQKRYVSMVVLELQSVWLNQSWMLWMSIL